MKQFNSYLIAAIAMFLVSGTTAKAQDWSSILSNVVSGVAKAVTGDETSATSIVGTWKYTGPDCKFESDNLLAKAGGEIASKKVESSMTKVCNKIGLKNTTCSFTFNEDGTYTQTINKRTINGTYTFNSSDKSLSLTTTMGFSATAQVSVSGSTMSMLFKADKMLSLLKTTAGVISQKSTNSAISTLTSLSDQYSGLRLGFELAKQ